MIRENIFLILAGKITRALHLFEKAIRTDADYASTLEQLGEAPSTAAFEHLDIAAEASAQQERT